jgi:hypothetical protein
MSGALGFSAARETLEPAALNVPLFRGLMQRMQDDARRVVLDLGPARPETVAMLGQYRCRLEIADLAAGLDALNAAAEPGELQTACAALLPPRRTETTDVVLCWDLLNYLERPALRALMDQISRRLAPGALVHALIAYSTPRMPARPARIAPDPELRLHVYPVTAEEKSAPRYSPDELSRLMPGYTVERAMLLKNGMQEFLFRR